ncbi:peptide/nickel transport system ATP-binding protein [Saccharopolyspora erythraea NRRL 2338]|uniref:Oligopeptide ABC transporter, ATP-binding protein n=2 Tax=Saccharopolyspora erythraea TaxID=1836 RepID=A4FLP5_SACEN|nr:ATP-binding cassette domain-containing protein [Saccharopolyspora erythraea]EQD83886.1 ABC transporter [Saccharopolyspora erythraea D]PFG98607.1 peptide/nickel transport system ATP-binding protein [Saccharopolyspora erythraea NRRL 2338]QRK88644.1 ATP-binding cassette domain-containing protein [Saccharopolyspora erythraea]CAM04970.1 oligopeptide ABC transporter, ATP-binding protein [Saccharopolyspora erythraea NRRL 2338]
MLSGTGLVAGYRKGIAVLDGVDVEVPRGTVTGLAGPSGCGKSTLARVLALLRRPWSGQVTVDGEAATGFRHATSRAQRAAIGVVFQQPRPAVDPRFTLRQVVAEPLHATGRTGEAPRRVGELAEQVGLTGELLDRRPHEVSDGQLQRACLARALALRPRYLICDEMTAMLDASTTAALVRVVGERVAEDGTGVLAISHDEPLLERWAATTLRLVDMTAA